MLNTPKTTFNLMLGTRDDGTRTILFECWTGGNLLQIRDNETFQSFLTACRESLNYFEDIGQQAHAHMTPSSEPTLFPSYQEEATEIAAWSRK